MTTPNHTQSSSEELDLSHLKDVRAVLKWCYDHGLLKGEFPTSDSSGKAYLLEQGEKRLMQLITAYTNKQVEEVLDRLKAGISADIPCYYDQDGWEVAMKHIKAIKALIATQVQEAYKKGYIDGGIDTLNKREGNNE